jgi:hypothetical protein
MGGCDVFWLVLLVFVLAGTALLVLVSGNRLPKTHVVTRMAYFNRSPAAIWQIVTDFSAQVAWRPDLRSVERLPYRGGREVWRETDTRGQTVTLETVEATPHRRLVRAIAAGTESFSGGWAMDIGEFGEVTSLTITETGEIANPFFRFVSRYIVGHTASIDRYLTALGKKLGVDVEIMSG